MVKAKMILQHDIATLRKMVAEKQTDITTLVAESKSLIAARDDKVNSFITVASDDMLKDTIAGSKQYEDGLLFGVPIAIKDNIASKNMKLTAASKMLANFDKPLYDATVVQRLIAAGAVNMGKLNLDEFAMGASNEKSYYGPVHNPYNLDYVSGGSSGGSAAAVAAGLVKATLGTDTGGSVRQPAAFTNTVGMKPTYGRVSRFGVIGFASSLDQVGVITKTVADNARVLSVIAGEDPNDTTSEPLEVPAYHENLSLDLQGKKIAVIQEYLSDDIDEEVRGALKAAIKVYEKLGAIVDVVSLPYLKYVVPAYYIISTSEASSNLARFDGIRYGYRAEGATDVESIYLQSRAEGFGPEVKKRIALGTYFLNQDAHDAYYVQAAKLRTLLSSEFTKIFASYDLILGPTTPRPAFKIGAHAANPMQMYLDDLCTIPASLIGIPALAVPAGFSRTGLPLSIQLMGRAFSEQLLYQFAYMFEQETKYYEQEPQGL
jgi:aspartyl-tRNA(Asn)/glutamyl-tRNA(Gln) amidotransferase subunit A